MFSIFDEHLGVHTAAANSFDSGFHGRCPFKESPVGESDFNLFVYADYYEPVFAQKIAYWSYRTSRQ